MSRFAPGWWRSVTRPARGSVCDAAGGGHGLTDHVLGDFQHRDGPSLMVAGEDRVGEPGVAALVTPAAKGVGRAGTAR